MKTLVSRSFGCLWMALRTDRLHLDLVWQAVAGEGEPQPRLPGCTVAVIEEGRPMTQLVHPVLKIKIEKRTRGETLTL